MKIMIELNKNNFLENKKKEDDMRECHSQITKN